QRRGSKNTSFAKIFVKGCGSAHFFAHGRYRRPAEAATLACDGSARSRRTSTRGSMQNRLSPSGMARSRAECALRGQGPTRDRRRKKEKIGFVPEKIVLESEKIEWRLKMIVC